MHSRDSIFFINAKDDLLKDGNKNRLREQDIRKIIDYYDNLTEEEGYSRNVPLAEIQSDSNNYNFEYSRYIDSSEPEDIQDLEGHLKGGIPQWDIENLENYWTVFASLKNSLFSEIREGYSKLSIPAIDIASVISNDSGVNSYKSGVQEVINKWKDKFRNEMYSFKQGDNPEQLITKLSEELMRSFSEDPLLDKYDVYQKLMEFWMLKMQDDMWLISYDGWAVCREFRAVEEGEVAEFEIKVGSKKVKQLGQVIRLL